jgi:acyl-CoA reductase-like NAD-dependent aldehyde dehydrogenase/alcohol dehydrogenase class IV
MDHYQLFIDGEFVEAEGGRTFPSIDPGTGATIATVAQAGKADAEAAIAAARRAFDKGEWSRMTPAARAEKLYDFADQIAQLGPRLGLVESMDSGQVIRLARFWGMAGSSLFRNLAHYAATKFPWQEEIPYAGNLSPARDYLRREPVGVCVGIIPWNFPASMAFWKIAQAITMGNTVVLKPASATPLSALIIAEAARVAGIPKGVINVVTGPGGELGRTLCSHPDVDKVAFTGSTEVGREIMRMASEGVKKVTLELGGKSANIILDDADIDQAVDGAIFGTFFHQGQVCDSGTRVLVSSKIYDQFLEKMKARTEKLRVGYQLDPKSHLGPLVSASQLAIVEGYVELGKQEGAELVTGGKRVEAPGTKGGFYYAPTIFSGVDNKMRIAQEEIFGPVVSVVKFEDDEEAVAIANDSIYGLAGGVFSNNVGRAERVAREMRTGTVWINDYHVFGDFCPFGGYKQSGVGRELGHAGLAEYTQIKRVRVSASGRTSSLFPQSRVSFLQYNCPTNVIAGHGSLASVNREVVRLGCRRALVITDPGVRKAGLVQPVQDVLAEFCAGVFEGVAQDAELHVVDAAAELARELKADCIVSVGGGSVLDTAKAVCVVMRSGGRANDHIAINRLTEPQAAHIAIPTTAGTGSEVSNVSVLKSRSAGRKVYIVDDHIVPNTAVLDPRFTLTLPKALTVSTGMDAMTHAIEAMTSILAQPISDGQALQAIRMIRANLPRVAANGKDEKARSELQIAATMAGWAFTVAQVGLVHAMAHTIGMLHGVHHGTACGIILPKVMRFNIDFAAGKLALVAQALGVNTLGMDERTAGLAAAAAIEALMEEVGHPMRLRDMGVPKEGLQAAGVHALADSAALFNARPVGDPRLVIELFDQVY